MGWLHGGGQHAGHPVEPSQTQLRVGSVYHQKQRGDQRGENVLVPRLIKMRDQRKVMIFSLAIQVPAWRCNREQLGSLTFLVQDGSGKDSLMTGPIRSCWG